MVGSEMCIRDLLFFFHANDGIGDTEALLGLGVGYKGATPPRCYHEAINPKTPNTAITD